MRISNVRRRWTVLFVAFGLLMTMGVPAMAAPPTTTEVFGLDGDDLMVTNGKNMWVLDADTGNAYHENIRTGRTNDISVASFLRVWYNATGEATTTATLRATYGFGGCGSTTWQTGSEFEVRYVSYADGLVISFEATGTDESGEVAYTIQGQNSERDWTGGHTQITEFQIKPLSGANSGSPNFITPWYSLQWDSTLNSSLGNITEDEVSGMTLMALGGTSNAVGFNYTNCGPNSVVHPTTSIRWTVDTLDITNP